MDKKANGKKKKKDGGGARRSGEIRFHEKGPVDAVPRCKLDGER